MNCIRVLTRILPFLYEADHLEGWEEKFFWNKKRKRSWKGQATRAEVLFDESQPDETLNATAKDQFEEVKPLGEELIDTLIDLLFLTEFTLPHNERSKSKISYAIWQSGVGCNTPMSSNKELESNRTEILRLLITLSSKSLYMPACMLLSEIVPSKANGRRYTSGKGGKSHHLYHYLFRQAGGIVPPLFTTKHCRF